MSDEVVLREVTLDERHEPTDNTEHFVGGSTMARPAKLRISHCAGDSGFALLYLDDSGEQLTDTWHLSLDDAMQQATFEFNVQPEAWQTVVDES